MSAVAGKRPLEYIGMNGLLIGRNPQRSLILMSVIVQIFAWRLLHCGIFDIVGLCQLLLC
jgi:hypothetical protein